jgi:transposase
MTVKEIAKAVGKDVTTVQRWVKKLSVKMQSVDSKMQSSSPMHPADYTQEEVLAIIEEGMGPEAAGVYRANATQPKAIDAKPSLPSGAALREWRMIFGDKAAITLSQYLGIEYEIIPFTANLGRISKQAFAVEMKEREKQRRLIEQDKRQSELF